MASQRGRNLSKHDLKLHYFVQVVTLQSQVTLYINNLLKVSELVSALSSGGIGSITAYFIRFQGIITCFAFIKKSSVNLL